MCSVLSMLYCLCSVCSKICLYCSNTSSESLITEEKFVYKISLEICENRLS